MAEESLISYLGTRASEYHRRTVQYDENDTDVLHLREDLEQQRLTSQIDRMLRRLRPESTPAEERSFPFGELNATVRLFDEAIILHFPRRKDQGVVVSLEPEAARDLNTFIGECERRLQR